MLSLDLWMILPKSIRQINANSTPSGKKLEKDVTAAQEDATEKAIKKGQV